MQRLTFLIILTLASMIVLADDPKLQGIPMGSSPSVDYSNNQSSTSVNQPSDALDGNLNTFYASYERNNTWVGLDLGTPHVITKVGWSPRNDGVGPQRVQFGRFEGANQADFSDAVPLHIVETPGTIGVISNAVVNVSIGFRYVRYCGPKDARCNIAEVEFYGHAGVGDDSNVHIAGGLPLVIINTNSGNDPVDKENQLPCYVKIIDTQGNVLADSAEIRLRGNASKDFPKKPYRIKFQTKHNVLGSPAKAKKWTLINNYGDKTLMRNMIAFKTSEMIGLPYTPFCTPVNVYVNGDYKGCYQLCDQIEVQKNRVAIDELTPQDNSGDILTGGYLIEIDAYANQEPAGQYFYSTRGNPVTFKSPSDEITTQQSNYIKNVFNQMESAVYSRNGWRTKLDEETFLKHFLVGELSGNTDTYWSVYMYKKRGDEKLYTGPVWDFDLAYNNDNRTYPISNLWDYVYATRGSIAGDMRNFVSSIVKNDASARNELKRLWSIARNNGLTAEALCNYVDSVANLLDEAQRLNFARWPILNQWVHMNPQISGSYQGEVNVVKNYLSSRVGWMDSKVGYDQTISSIENLAEEDGLIRIWTLQGLLIYEGEEMPTLSEGIYIVQKNNKIQKTYIQ